jgi:hypothetical protein
VIPHYDKILVNSAGDNLLLPKGENAQPPDSAAAKATKSKV